MLAEVPHTRQVPGDYRRRWFTNTTFDLIVWYSGSDSIVGFQLCYRLDSSERALTWLKDSGYRHSNVDTGEPPAASHAMTPVLLPDGTFDAVRIRHLFESASTDIEPDIRRFVIERLDDWPGHPAP